MTVALSRRWALLSSSQATAANRYTAGAIVGAKDGTLLRLPVGCVGTPEVLSYGANRYWWCGSTGVEDSDIVIAPYDGYPLRTRDFGGHMGTCYRAWQQPVGNNLLHGGRRDFGWHLWGVYVPAATWWLHRRDSALNGVLGNLPFTGWLPVWWFRRRWRVEVCQRRKYMGKCWGYP